MSTYNLKSFRTDEMTQKEYAEYLRITIRTVQNWEARGTSKTTFALLRKIFHLRLEIERLKKKLEDNNMTFNLEK